MASASAGRVHLARPHACRPQGGLAGLDAASAMLHRRPDLPRHMAGGANNPLGARAMYLYSGGRDTHFRIHGSNEPWTIGHGVSSGCIRMLNGDVTDLYNRVKVGAQVNVL